MSHPQVHRDLKSPNLLVDKDFTVKVCDLNLLDASCRVIVQQHASSTKTIHRCPCFKQDAM